jgi:tyrosine-protein kinase Etk/Wzc
MEKNKNLFVSIMRSVIIHRRRIIINTFVVLVLAVVLVLVLPHWYRATVVLLPPEKSDNFSELAMSMGLKSAMLSGGGFALPVMASQSDLLASIAESRTVAEYVVDSLKLVEVFDADDRDDAVKHFLDNINVHVRADGIIEISYESKHQDLVADIANTIALALDNINRLHKTQKARELKRFIKEELQKNERELGQAEVALQEFQREHKAISIDNQTAASIQAAADLYSQLTLEQIDLKVMEHTHSADHPDVIKLRYKVDEIKRRLMQIQEGVSGPEDSSTAFLAIPFNELPELSIRFLQLMRDLKREESLHEVLVTQYEQAKIMEAKDTPTISVLDWAKMPDEDVRPRGVMIVLMAFFLSAMFSTVLAVAGDRWKEYSHTNPENYQDISTLLKSLRKDLFGFKQKRNS